MLTHESFFVIAVGNIVRKPPFALGLLHTVRVLFFCVFFIFKCYSPKKVCFRQQKVRLKTAIFAASLLFSFWRFRQKGGSAKIFQQAAKNTVDNKGKACYYICVAYDGDK